MKDFSVLMSVYYKDNAKWFDDALCSVLINQSTKPSEIIVVEDGKLTKELYDVIAKYEKIFKNFISVKILTNRGLGNALNKGLEKCNYDIVARMDSDDISKSNRFEEQLNLLEMKPNIDIVGAWIDEFEISTENVTSIRWLPEKQKSILKFAHERCPLNHPVVMFKKSAVLSAGGYKHFPLFEDYYLWVRMLINGSQFYNIQESLLFFRFSSEMLKRRGGIKYAIEELKFQKKILDIGFNDTPTFFRNSAIRFSSRIIPNNLRKLLYKRILRKT
jgi:glycosyltransferase involved in cell wall biosynthesis